MQEKLITVLIKKEQREKLNLIKYVMKKHNLLETIDALISSYLKDKPNLSFIGENDNGEI